MPYLHYLCLFAHSGVQHILCCVFVCFSSSCVPYVGMSHSFLFLNKGLIHAQCQNNTSTGIENVQSAKTTFLNYTKVNGCVVN
jgi:hypothetical protein